MTPINEWHWFLDTTYLAQCAHFLTGSSVILASALLFKSKGAGWKPILWTLVIGMLIITVKEYWLDIEFEKDTWYNSTIDWIAHLLGSGAGMVIVLFSNRLAAKGAQA